MGERITFFGDISDIRLADLRAFVEVTRNHKIGGSFPTRRTTRTDAENISRAVQTLIQAGVANCALIVPCSSVQERATQILQNCHLHSTRVGLGQYWIIDQNPDSLAAAMKSCTDPRTNNPVEGDLLRSMTVINLGLPEAYDYTDKTGIRICSLSHPLVPFPAHPTPSW